jgi:hypothetical protein
MLFYDTCTTVFDKLSYVSHSAKVPKAISLQIVPVDLIYFICHSRMAMGIEANSEIACECGFQIPGRPTVLLQ